VVIEEELDPHAIFASVGEVPYEWLIDSDRIVWGRNVGAVLPVADPAALDHGRSYAQLVDPNGGPSRFDAVMRASASDCGSGVPYQLQYALNAALASTASDQRGHSISARAIARPASAAPLGRKGFLARWQTVLRLDTERECSSSATKPTTGPIISRPRRPSASHP
jgi:hypothetical protein